MSASYAVDLPAAKTFSVRLFYSSDCLQNVDAQNLDLRSSLTTTIYLPISILILTWQKQVAVIELVTFSRCKLYLITLILKWQCWDLKQDFSIITFLDNLFHLV